MSPIRSSLLLGAGDAAGGFQVSRSLRFNSGDSAYLNRTPASAGNRKTWTWSGWVKRTKFGNYEHIFAGTGSSPSYAQFYWSPSEQLVFDNGGSGAITTTQVFRDTSAWYHIVLIFDTTQGTAADRMRMYVNGSQITSFSSSSYPSQNSDGGMNQASIHYIGKENVNYSNFYLANIHFIDGQALTPSSFTETDATTGQLIPKTYTGSYGTNGFNLLFADNSSNTASTLGKDTSPNGNNWTPNNLSVTAGAGNDSLVDSPTNYGTDTGVGGEVRSNYCTFNPLISTSGPISNGNLEMVGANAWRNTKGTISVSTGKWYFEATYTGSQFGSALGNLAAGVGFCKPNITTPNVDISDSSLYGSILAFSQTGHVNNFNAPTSARSQIASGDVIGFALNYDAGNYTIYVNNTSTSSGSLNFTGELTPWTNAYYSGSYFILNAGQRAFAYTAPSGFKALCTQNLPAPLVTKSSTVFDVITYTGTGSSLTLPNGSSTPTSIAFTPDFVWLKGRSGATDHAIYDSVRDVQKDLVSNSTAAETTQTTGLTAFGTNTFTVGSLAKLNTSSATYVTWCWDAGTSTVANPDGSITSQVRANPTAGFSVVSVPGYTYPTKTAGHGLGVEPHFIITKSRGVSNPWIIYHKSAGANTYFQFDTGAGYTGVAGVWSGVTSTVFPLNSGVNQQTDIVAYCFAPVVGYSGFGSYVGNGSSDGVFVFTGFRSRYIMIKRSSGIGDWVIYDSVRLTYNASNVELYANSSGAEVVDDPIDILSNGFKIRTTGSGVNSSGNTYVFAAFAESPFNYSRAR
jgi:hypothetical protein